MSGIVTLVPRNAQIDLAHEADFHLGDMRVSPSTREVWLNGRREVLQPRAMQALVALARAQGAMVSRDDLAQTCWGGVIVSDDALNRAIGKLRRLSEAGEGRSFTIETVPRVGYRLKSSDASPSHPSREALAGEEVRRRRGLAPTVATAAGIAAAGALAGWIALGPRPPGEWQVEGYQVLAGAQGPENKPDLSPDGRFLAYDAPPPETPAAGSDIYIRAVSGGEPLRIVAGPRNEVAPAWSPAGDQLAFVRMDSFEELSEKSPPCRIFIKHVPDGLERQVGGCAKAVGTPRLEWANPHTLVFADGPVFGPSRIVALDVTTGVLRELTRPTPGTPGDFDGVVSPDGRKLAFRRDIGGVAFSGDIYVQDLRTGTLRRITHDGMQGHVEWSPDGRSLFISSNRQGEFSLWSFPASGRGAPQRLMVGLRAVRRLDAAPGMLAFETRSERVNIFRRDGDRDVRLTSGGGRDFASAVAVDGTLAFLTQDDGYWVSLQRQGEPAHRLAKLPLAAAGLAWSPDGRSLATILYTDTEADIHVIDVASGKLQRLAQPGAEPGWPSWSADSRAVVYGATDARGDRMWRFPIAPGSKATPLTPYGWWGGLQSGDAVYARRADGRGIWRVSPSGRAVRVADVDMRDKMFLVHRDRIVLIEQTGRQKRIWSQPLSGGPRRLEGVLPPEWTATAVPDFDPFTGGVVYTRFVEREADIGLLRLSRKAPRVLAWP